MEKKIKHLEMIEAIIERMAKNSLQLKEWTMALVVLIVTISTQSGNKDFIFSANLQSCGSLLHI